MYIYYTICSKTVKPLTLQEERKCHGPFLVEEKQSIKEVELQLKKHQTKLDVVNLTINRIRHYLIDNEPTTERLERIEKNEEMNQMLNENQQIVMKNQTLVGKQWKNL